MMIEDTRPIIIRNAIMTPDRTFLRSFHVHDYVTHTDEITGEKYVVDGGTQYLRRSVNEVPAEDFTVTMQDKFTLIRYAFVWKSYGKNYEHLPEGIYIALCDMTDDHIEAILNTQVHIRGTYVEELMIAELQYRKCGTLRLDMFKHIKEL
jgi:hypothetical protein